MSFYFKGLVKLVKSFVTKLLVTVVFASILIGINCFIPLGISFADDVNDRNIITNENDLISVTPQLKTQTQTYSQSDNSISEHALGKIATKENDAVINHDYSSLETQEFSESLDERSEGSSSDDLASNPKLKYFKAAEQPQKYDTRVVHPTWVQPVRAQGNFGTCWAHAATASAYASEKSLSSFTALSPRHLVYSSWNPNQPALWGSYANDPMQNGGSHQNAVLAWSEGRGAVTESKFPYPTNPFATIDPNPLIGTGNTSDIRQQDFALRSTSELPKPLNTNFTLNRTNLNIIKSEIITKGVVDMSYNGLSENYYDPNHYSWFNPSASNANHSVIIVGWDDEFSKNDFKTTAPADGAWIVQNSWGTSWGDSGYFYLSYYDRSAADFITFDVQNKTNNETVQFLDDQPAYSSLSFSTEELFYANHFTSPNSFQELKSVSVTLHNPEISGKFEIFVGSVNSVNHSTNNLGTLVYSQTFSTTFAGYKRFNLIDTIKLSPSTEYTILFYEKSNQEKVSATYEYSFNGPTKEKISIQEGQSFISIDGKTFSDFKELLKDRNSGNFDIKGYLTPATPDVNKIYNIHYGKKDSPFSDIYTTELNPFRSNINFLWFYDITTGVSPSKYAPNGFVTRAQMALFLWRLAGKPESKGIEPASVFSDVSKELNQTKTALRWLINNGVTTGTTPTTYSPNKPVTRAQMAMFMYRMNGSKGVKNYSKFADIKDQGIFIPAIKWMADQKITTGIDLKGTIYAPKNNVTRAQMAAFMDRFCHNVLKNDGGYAT